jgi:tRNA/tmRNA/rRNA uracil-C5-methylase (TrmA/RlmC/RlmD family)
MTTTSMPGEIGPIGFKEKASHRLVDVPYSHIAIPEINDALHRLREEKREEARRGLLKKPVKGATLLGFQRCGRDEGRFPPEITMVVVLDPPKKKGCSEEARDSNFIRISRCKHIQPFGLFPQTRLNACLWNGSLRYRRQAFKVSVQVCVIFSNMRWG